jgi:hypothetical protein
VALQQTRIDNFFREARRFLDGAFKDATPVPSSGSTPARSTERLTNTRTQRDASEDDQRTIIQLSRL